MKQTKICIACVALIASTMASSAFAQSNDGDGNEKPFSLFGDALESATGISAFGFLQIGYSSNNTSTHDQATAGHTNLPIVGAPDEGLQLNALSLALEKPITTNILPRITPTPGPVPWDFSWGFRTELLYGRNALPAQMFGFDSQWAVNATPAGVAPGSTRQNYVAMPQVFVQAYFPVGLGVAAMFGRFGSGVGHDIAPDWRPGPNVFYSKTYTFVAQPDQVYGGLISANLMRNENGFLAGEFGIVKGRQNLNDNNNSNSTIGALRWRSTDMNTWVDYSFMSGDEQNDPTVNNIQMPISRIISANGQKREHHSLSVGFKPADAWQANVEYVYGKQSGDGQPGTIDILTFNPAIGNFFTGGEYSGIVAQAVFSASDKLSYGARYENFKDTKGVALFPVTAVPSEFNAVTLGMTYKINKSAILRPEVRYDWQTGNNGINAFGGGTADKQTTLSTDLIIYF